MMPETVSSQADLGRRIAAGREDASLTQAELAEAVGLERSAVTKIEAGTRKVSATELVAIATALGRRIDWFVTEPPPAVLSRRRDPTLGGTSRALDLEIEKLARDVSFLVDHGVIEAGVRERFDVPSDFVSAEALAERARRMLPDTEGPLLDLQGACERFGLIAFAIDLGPAEGDAAYVEVDNLGVALINGSTDPGRRRFSLAHEFGHHLVGDAYASESAVGGSAETERLLNAFAVHFLLPRKAVTRMWTELSSLDTRLAAVAIAVRFRVSWTVACNQLRNLDLIDHQQRAHLISQDLQKGEFLQLGERWVEELVAPSVPPDYGRRIVSAFKAGRLTAERTVELLQGTVSKEELPIRDEISLDWLRREFDPLP
jgi:Zn-dependent peptidase ImmA (M78 family)/transcriptional regulator with XRE-family HTH domain